MSDRNFFSELKRRNVYKVAIAYAVVAWLLIQAASILFPTYEAPAWVMKVFVAIVALGFPIALVIAWAFEMTPQGLKRTEETSPGESLPYWSRRKFAALIICVGLAAAGLYLFQFTRWNPAPKTAARPDAGSISEKSVAVLPFENFNRDPDNAYFAEGIQDEILTRLAKIDDLKVISRTSTHRYKSSPENLPEIARQLGVANILEGSVQKSGDKVRVTVQLIRASTDSHLWAETFDRGLTDIFAVESEIAENIAKALRAKLTAGEQRAVTVKPTENPEAYDAYLRGLALWNGISASAESMHNAEKFFQRAVDLDPKFAQAWANLSVVQTFIYAEFDPRTQQLTNAKRSLDRATQLQPDLGDVFFALGLYRYRGLRDYDGALKAFEEAIERGANRATSLEFIGYVKRRQGRWEEALASLAESAALDPRNVIIFSERAVTLRALRRFAEARGAVDRALEINSNNPLLLAQKARIYQAEGDFATAEKLIQRLPLDRQQLELVGTRYLQWTCTRQFGEAARVLEELLAQPEPLPQFLGAIYRARLGTVRRWTGDTAGARRDLILARDQLETLRQQSVDGEGFLDSMIVLDGLLGDQAAVDLRALKLQDRIAHDAFEGPLAEEAMAGARTQLGQTDAAVTILRGLLQKPGNSCLTTALLRADPMWDPLRSDPRFQELVSTKP
jgi:TolB-like protein/Tfp pilus assembly protein PilF